MRPIEITRKKEPPSAWLSPSSCSIGNKRGERTVLPMKVMKNTPTNRIVELKGKDCVEEFMIS